MNFRKKLVVFTQLCEVTARLYTTVSVKILDVSACNLVHRRWITWGLSNIIIMFLSIILLHLSTAIRASFGHNHHGRQLLCPFASTLGV